MTILISFHYFSIIFFFSLEINLSWFINEIKPNPFANSRHFPPPASSNLMPPPPSLHACPCHICLWGMQREGRTTNKQFRNFPFTHGLHHFSSLHTSCFLVHGCITWVWGRTAVCHVWPCWSQTYLGNWEWSQFPIFLTFPRSFMPWPALLSPACLSFPTRPCSSFPPWAHDEGD